MKNLFSFKHTKQFIKVDEFNISVTIGNLCMGVLNKTV